MERSSTPPVTCASKSAPDPEITEPGDAVIRIAATCVCGSDLWSYRGANRVTEPMPFGHQYCGLVQVADGYRAMHSAFSPAHGQRAVLPGAGPSGRGSAGDRMLPAWCATRREHAEIARQPVISTLRG